jgi:hypothetical protein
MLRIKWVVAAVLALFAGAHTMGCGTSSGIDEPSAENVSFVSSAIDTDGGGDADAAAAACAQALAAVNNAQMAYNAARANYDACMAAGNASTCTVALAQLADAQSNLNAAIRAKTAQGC